MSTPGTRQALQCLRCSRPFGFKVAFCPFCGAAQETAAPRPPPPPPRPRPDPVPAPPPRPPEPAPDPTPPGRPATDKPRRRWAAAALLAAAGVGAGLLLMRAAPMASLVVAVSPNVSGTVLIDGKPSGPPGRVVQVPTGAHGVGFEAEGWLAAPREAVLQAGQRSTLTLALTPRPSVLALSRDPPDAAVRLDDRVVDAGQGEVTVAAGRHSLTATHRGYAPLTLDLTLERGERRMVKVALAPIATQVVNLQAAPGQWSEPLALPPRTGFTLVLGGRIRLRIGQEVYLVEAGAPLNLGDVRAQSLQVKAVDGPVDVRVLLRPEG